MFILMVLLVEVLLVYKVVFFFFFFILCVICVGAQTTLDSNFFYLCNSSVKGGGFLSIGLLIDSLCNLFFCVILFLLIPLLSCISFILFYFFFFFLLGQSVVLFNNTFQGCAVVNADLEGRGGAVYVSEVGYGLFLYNTFVQSRSLGYGGVVGRGWGWGEVVGWMVGC
jgi:hypothetical protein